MSAHMSCTSGIRLFTAAVNGSQVEKAITLREVLQDKDWLLSQDWAKGAGDLWEHEKSVDGAGVVDALIDQFICVRSTVFFGTPGSSFSNRVELMREGESRVLDSAIHNDTLTWQVLYLSSKMLSEVIIYVMQALFDMISRKTNHNLQTHETITKPEEQLPYLAKA